MCYPCWLNVKRTLLGAYALMAEGQTFDIGAYPIEVCPRAKATLLIRHQEENGVLLFVHIRTGDGVMAKYWDGPRVLWCPNWGAGGWVDIPKVASPGSLVANFLQLANWKIMHREQEALNCMAL